MALSFIMSLSFIIWLLVQTSYIKRIKLFLFGHIINILLTELGRSVWENLDLGRSVNKN